MAGQRPLEALSGEAVVLVLFCSQCAQGGTGWPVAAGAEHLCSVSVAAPGAACEVLLHLMQAQTLVGP